MFSLYLASGSPRRHELLTLLGVPFEVILTHTEEQRQEGEAAENYVRRLAQDKARAGVSLAQQDWPVLGADTIVVLNGQVLEKPHWRVCWLLMCKCILLLSRQYFLVLKIFAPRWMKRVACAINGKSERYCLLMRCIASINHNRMRFFRTLKMAL